jgi:hypothetical protein
VEIYQHGVLEFATRVEFSGTLLSVPVPPSLPVTGKKKVHYQDLGKINLVICLKEMSSVILPRN